MEDKKKKQENPVRIKWGIYIREDIMKKVKRDAKADDRSINYIIEKILEAHYE